MSPTVHVCYIFIVCTWFGLSSSQGELTVYPCSVNCRCCCRRNRCCPQCTNISAETVWLDLFYYFLIIAYFYTFITSWQHAASDN